MVECWGCKAQATGMRKQPYMVAFYTAHPAHKQSRRQSIQLTICLAQNGTALLEQPLELCNLFLLVLDL